MYFSWSCISLNLGKMDINMLFPIEITWLQTCYFSCKDIWSCAIFIPIAVWIWNKLLSYKNIWWIVWPGITWFDLASHLSYPLEFWRFDDMSPILCQIGLRIDVDSLEYQSVKLGMLSWVCQFLKLVSIMFRTRDMGTFVITSQIFSLQYCSSLKEMSNLPSQKY